MVDQEALLDLTFNDSSTTENSNKILIGKLLTHKTVNYTAFVSIISAAWNMGQNIHFKPLDKNMISCTFKRQEDMVKFESSGPWSVKGAILNLKRWSPNLTLEEIDFSECPFWIQVHNLPLNRMNLDNATKIGNFIGKFLQSEDDPTSYYPRKFIRIQVNIDTQKALKVGCFITREDGSKLWVAFRYEHLSDFCYGCGKVCHTEQACTESDSAVTSSFSQQGFGPWMRASSHTQARTFKETPSKTSSTRKLESENQNAGCNDKTEHISTEPPILQSPRYERAISDLSTITVRSPIPNTSICSPSHHKDNLFQSPRNQLDNNTPLIPLKANLYPISFENSGTSPPPLHSYSTPFDLSPSQTPLLFQNQPKPLLSPDHFLTPVNKKRANHSSPSGLKKSKHQLDFPEVNIFSSFSQLHIQPPTINTPTEPSHTQQSNSEMITEERVIIRHRRFLMNALRSLGTEDSALSKPSDSKKKLNSFLLVPSQEQL